MDLKRNSRRKPLIFLYKQVTFGKMQASVKRQAKSKRLQGKAKRSHRAGRNGHLHIIGPATASEIRSVLHIGGSQLRNILRAFDAAGVKT